MNDSTMLNTPEIHSEILDKSEEIGFTMPSDLYIGSLLRTLITSKPGGQFLELGTGIGLSLSWMVEGLNETAELTTIDNDVELISIAMGYFGKDPRVKIICEDAGHWIQNNADKSFDLIFADAWPGKYSQIDEILSMVNKGGFYVIDDMSQQPNWPEGHGEKVEALINYMENREDFTITKLNWSTGLIVATKK